MIFIFRLLTLTEIFPHVQNKSTTVLTRPSTQRSPTKGIEKEEESTSVVHGFVLYNGESVYTVSSALAALILALEIFTWISLFSSSKLPSSPNYNFLWVFHCVLVATPYLMALQRRTGSLLCPNCAPALYVVAWCILKQISSIRAEMLRFVS